MRKKIKNLKVILHLDGEEKQRITKQLSGFQEQTLVTQDLEKKIKSLPRDYFTNLFYLWHEGLPNFARVCIWPIVIGNPLQI